MREDIGTTPVGFEMTRSGRRRFPPDDAKVSSRFRHGRRPGITYVMEGTYLDPRGARMLKATKTGLLNWLHARIGHKGRRRWHRATSAMPVLLRDGTLSTPGAGQLWRRQTESGGWEYEQDDGFEEPDDID